MRFINILIPLFFSLFSQAQNPNIIWIWGDDLGHGEVGYNNPDFYTPHIDTLAARGAKFTRFYAQPSCTPSRVALMTGRYPFRQEFGVGVVGPYEDRHMRTEFPILPELLKGEGYTTAIIGKWHLGHAYPEHLPNPRGFDYQFGNYLGDVNYWTHEYPTLNAYDLHENGEIFDGDSIYYTELLGQKSVEYIEKVTRCGDTPFFMYISMLAPHTPHQAPSDTAALAPGSFSAEEKTKWAMIRILDNEVGKIWDAVIDNGIENNTIIIFTSDNGATLLAPPGDNRVGDNTPFRGEKGQLYDGGTRVPFLWYHNNTVTAQTIDTACHLVDIMPTFIEGVLGSSIGHMDSLDGMNIYPLLSGGSIAGRGIILNYIPNASWAVVKGRFKLANNPEKINNDAGPYADNIVLYDTDIDETTDRSATYPSIVTELQAIINSLYSSNTQTIRSSAPAGWNPFEIVGDPKTFYDEDYYYYRGN